MNQSPPPLSGTLAPVDARTGRAKTAIAVALLTPPALCGLLLWLVKVAGLIHAFSSPTASMAPTISRGDDFYVESFSYRLANPRRGDVIAFKTDGLPIYDQHALYVKRLVGLPGDRLRLANGVLFVNEQPSTFRNKGGVIRYMTMPHGKFLGEDSATLIVPPDHYFVLGDNSAQSLDSRHFGCIDAQAITGRTILCYWPFGHLGFIR